MSAEPFMINEAKLGDDGAVHVWALTQIEIARSSGAQWQRLSQDPNDKLHILHEAWFARPDEQGEPRWKK